MVRRKLQCLPDVQMCEYWHVHLCMHMTTHRKREQARRRED